MYSNRLVGVILLCLAIWGATSTRVQVGARFPRGIQLGEDANCTAAEDEGFLRFVNSSVQYCNNSEWITLGETQVAELNDIRERLNTLENDVGSPVSIEGLRQKVEEGNRLHAIELCHKHGVYDSQEFICNCNCDAVRGCWDPLRDCTECMAGWTGEFCTGDIEAPVLSVLGTTAITIEATHTPYVPPAATAQDNRDGDVTSSIVVTNNVVSNLPGTYTVTYDITDELGNHASHTISVVVEDTTVPEISVLGDSPVTIEAGSLYVDDGAVASDNAQLSSTTPSNNLAAFDTRVVGTFTVEYDFTDDNGNDAVTANRAVVVIDTTAPSVTLNKGSHSLWQLGEEYVDDGLTITDNAVEAVEGFLYDNVAVSSNMNISEAGTYTVNYTVVDESGNSVTVARTVDVQLLPISCNDLFHNFPEMNEGNGPYRTFPDSSVLDTYCVFTSNGGYDLLFNLHSRDGVNRHYDDTNFWLSTNAVGSADHPLSSDSKLEAFSRLPLGRVMMLLHSNGTAYGHAEYNMLSTYAGSTLQSLLSTVNDVTVTTTRIQSEGDGSIGLTHNADRPQGRFGDPFLDNSDAISFNRQSAWGACTNQNRVTTTANNGAYEHTFHGLGGIHEESCAATGYGVKYESAPISSYCDLTNAYGDEASFAAGGLSLLLGGSRLDPYRSQCRGPTFAWKPVDTAMLVRLPVSHYGVPQSCDQLYTNDETLADGVYNVTRGGVLTETYCSFRNGRGFDLVFNLNTRDNEIRHHDDDTFWESSLTVGSVSNNVLDAEYKSSLYASHGLSKVLIELHDGAGNVYGSAEYTVLGDYQYQSLASLMASVSGITYTTTRENVVGNGRTNIGLAHNTNRGQSEYGDIFLDYSDALVLNRPSGWSACENLNRIATTLSNSQYPHTVGGLGGKHREGCSSTGYGTLYEAAPITSYCDARNGYGSASTVNQGSAILLSGSGYFIWRSACLNASFQWRQVDVSLYAIPSE